MRRNPLENPSIVGQWSVALLILLGLCTQAVAQSSEADLDIDVPEFFDVAACSASGVFCTTELSRLDAAMASLDAELGPLSQEGNSARIVQQNAFGLIGNTVTLNVSGMRNRTVQNQNGGENQSILSVQGSDNQVLIDQTGDQNSSNFAVLGDGNRIEHIQEGTGLSFNLQHDGSGKSISIRQWNQ